MQDLRDFARTFVNTVLWDIQPWVNAGIGLFIVCYITHRLLCCSQEYTQTERVSMGLLVSGMLMATPALWMKGTPFDGWSFNVARVGIAMYIVTNLRRRTLHRQRNLEQQAYAEGFQDGKLRAVR